MRSHGLHGIRRTGGIEAAALTERWRDESLVRTEKAEDQHPRGGADYPERTPHFQSTPARPSNSPTSLTTSGARAPPIAPRATRTTSQPSCTRGEISLQASRRSRRARLRATAPPTLRPATQAARGGPDPRATYTTTRSERSVEAVFTIRWTSSDPRSLASLDGELRPALRPSPGKDPPPRPSAHPQTEPVGPISSAFVGLERPFHVPRLREIGSAMEVVRLYEFPSSLVKAQSPCSAVGLAPFPHCPLQGGRL